MYVKCIALLVCALWALAQGIDMVPLTAKDSLDSGPPFPDSTHAPGPVTTTQTSSTTASTPTTSKTPTTTTPSTTTTPKTTTTAPTPTTTTTTTTTPNTTTTTTTPKTTTTSPTTPKPTTTPTTTVKPSPTPKPDDKPAVNEYVGNYSDISDICLLVKMAIQVEVLAKDKNSTVFNVPKTANSSASCQQNNTVEFLTVTWDSNKVDFEFAKHDNRFDIHSINVTVLLPGDNASTTFYHNKSEFSVSDDMSYYCSRDQPLNLTFAKSNDTVAKLHLSSLQYQAFMHSTKNQYAPVWNCDGANTPDAVPVVVGCVLAVLVVLVLVVYLLGRRRCQARGYLSM